MSELGSDRRGSVLIHDAEVVVTMDAQRGELRGGSVLVRGNIVEAVGARADLEQRLLSHEDGAPVQRIDARRLVVLPGLVNGHHHLYQSLTRAIGTAAGLSSFDWLSKLYPIWARLTPDAAYVSAKLALCELVVEREQDILADSQRLLEQLHDRMTQRPEPAHDRAASGEGRATGI